MWFSILTGYVTIVCGLLLLARKMELRLKWAVPWALTASAVCLWLASRLGVLVPGLRLWVRLARARLRSGELVRGV